MVKISINAVEEIHTKPIILKEVFEIAPLLLKK